MAGTKIRFYSEFGIKPDFPELKANVYDKSADVPSYPINNPRKFICIKKDKHSKKHSYDCPSLENDHGSEKVKGTRRSPIVQMDQKSKSNAPSSSTKAEHFRLTFAVLNPFHSP